jgi:DNA-binding transcriptional MerR regulator
MLTPRQLSESLIVPTSTLRRWAIRFQKHLSPHTPGKHREYTISDMDTLRKVRDWLADGMTYDDIENKLDIADVTPDASTALMTITEYTQAIEDARAVIQVLKTQIDTQNERLQKIENWLSQPWHKRIFTKPPTE